MRKTNQKKQNLETKPIAMPKIKRRVNKTDGLVTMLWPIFLELIMAGIFGNANQLILNSFSPIAVAATTAAGQFLLLAVNMYTIFSVGQAILLAPFWGAENDREGIKILWSALFDNICFALILSTVGVLMVPRVLEWMNVPGELYSMGHGYLEVVLGFSLFQAVTITFSAALRAMGKMKTVMAGNLIINGCCVGMNLGILLFVPENRQTIIMYAFAGVFSQILGGVFFYLALRFDARVREIQNLGQRIGIQEFMDGLWRNTVRIARLGFFGGMEGVIYLASQTMVVSMMGMLGTQVLTAKGYSGNLITYMALPANAVPLAAATMIGMAAGKHGIEEMQRVFFKCMRVSLILTGAACAVSILISRSFLLVYTKDAALIKLCIEILLIDCILEFARSIAALVVVSLKAVGDVKLPFRMVIIGSVLNLFVSWLLGINMGWGLPGIWMGYGADMVYRGALGMWYWRRHARRKDYPIWRA